MIDAHFRNISELEARIHQTVRDLEEHCRKLPAAQQGTVKETIEKLERALEGEETFISDKRKRSRKRAPCC
jgi:hypothetical protein